MSEPSQPPSADRLLSRIAALDAPLVQLWGWPGSGRTAVLEALLARHGRQALGLPLAAVGSEAVPREAPEGAREVRVPWLGGGRGGGGGRWASAGWWRAAGRTRNGSPRPSAGCSPGSGWRSPPTNVQGR